MFEALYTLQNVCVTIISPSPILSTFGVVKPPYDVLQFDNENTVA